MLISTLTSTEQERLARLEPATQALVRQLILTLSARGFYAFIGSTKRTQAQEEAARASGHSSEHQTRSWHELGRAADLPLRGRDGGPNYDTSNEAYYRALYAEATLLGLRSLAYRLDGSRLLLHTVKGLAWDPSHVEYRDPYSTLDEAIAAELP